AALGRSPGLEIFGWDYPTFDGPGVRDYIHVNDLARAHLLALQGLEGGIRSQVLNCGYGHGFSVRQVVDAVRKVTGRDFPVKETGRREGDPPQIVAQCHLIRDRLSWHPEHDDLEYIIRTAWEWEKTLEKREKGEG
ncbi:MAG: UDP-glucose 4-epimerase, partial [Proteobacteria bacterium]|nr:UDP-glucose 4-epimerase [Pseudomonadota bacterium]